MGTRRELHIERLDACPICCQQTSSGGGGRIPSRPRLRLRLRLRAVGRIVSGLVRRRVGSLRIGRRHRCRAVVFFFGPEVLQELRNHVLNHKITHHHQRPPCNTWPKRRIKHLRRLPRLVDISQRVNIGNLHRSEVWVR